ncbi:MAG: rhomboid family intramembrane serine protease [Candidatus Poribacteria bacterium]
MFIPLKSEQPPEKPPIITTMIIIINVAVFIYQQFPIHGYGRDLAAVYGAIPYEFTHFVDLRPRSPYPFFLSNFTHIFLHGGFLHIIGNMLYFNAFAPNIEGAVGHFKFLIFYLLCGIVAAVVYIIPNFNSQVPMIGASGAIAGIMGAHLRVFPGKKIVCLLLILRIPIWAFVVLIPWILLQIYNVVMQGQSNVAFLAHIGGFIFGLFAVVIFREKWFSKREKEY